MQLTFLVKKTFSVESHFQAIQSKDSPVNFTSSFPIFTTIVTNSKFQVKDFKTILPDVTLQFQNEISMFSFVGEGKSFADFTQGEKDGFPQICELCSCILGYQDFVYGLAVSNQVFKLFQFFINGDHMWFRNLAHCNFMSLNMAGYSYPVVDEASKTSPFLSTMFMDFFKVLLSAANSSLKKAQGQL